MEKQMFPKHSEAPWAGKAAGAELNIGADALSEN
jgi:hypothetical protein